MRVTISKMREFSTWVLEPERGPYFTYGFATEFTKWDDTTFRGLVTTLMIFASYTQGFKSGGFGIENSSGAVPAYETVQETDIYPGRSNPKRPTLLKSASRQNISTAAATLTSPSSCMNTKTCRSSTTSTWIMTPDAFSGRVLSMEKVSLHNRCTE